MSAHLHHVPQQTDPRHLGQIVSLQLITIAWMTVEAGVALLAAVRAHSVALFGFGADSAIEFLSALIVFLRFKRVPLISEKRAAQLTGLLLFALAAFILASSVLAFTHPAFRPQPSYLGIAVLIMAAALMPWLAARKRNLAVATNSGSLRADSVQSSMCAYLSWIALAGLILNALFKFSWADPAAGLLLLPIVLREAWESMRGKSCADDACCLSPGADH